MVSLYLKEVRGFFSGLTGYLVIVIFLLLNGMFLWIIPGETNILDMGLANLNSLFQLAPWVFLFLVPAITMRMFAEERRTGTMEMLLTRPITESKIVISKYLAAYSLVILAIVPTLVYFYSVWQLGTNVGNLDLGATLGSYLGLLFLAAIYTAIGIFTSSVTENQIVAFLFGMSICFLFFIGFDYISSIPVLSSIELVIMNIGINEHYNSISRGVIDLGDLIYFVGVVAIFILATTVVVKRR